jgi:archaellin
MAKFCPTCGKPLQFENAEICPNCGVRIQGQPAPIKGEKSPGIAALLSIFPGLGHVYNGDLKRGTIFLIGTFVGFLFFIIPGVIIWIYQIYDAYSTSKKMNAGEIPFEEANTTEIIFYIILLIVAIILFIIIFLSLAAIFSYILLGSNYFSAQKTRETVYEDVYKSYNIQMMGNVYGLASNPSTGIDEITFVIVLAPGAQAMDLTKMKIVFSAPGKNPIILTQGATASTSIFTTQLSTVNSQTPVSSMDLNQQIVIDFKIAPIGANTEMNFELRPSVGAVLPFSKTTPDKITKTNVLL